MQTHDYTKPPRTMPHTFARQEQEIKRLQKELGEANDRIVELTKALATMNERQRQEWARAESAEAWGQRAHNALFLAEQTADHTTINLIRKVLKDAPESVKGETK
jgi:uncharacterized protein HemX